MCMRAKAHVHVHVDVDVNVEEDVYVVLYVDVYVYVYVNADCEVHPKNLTHLPKQLVLFAQRRCVQAPELRRSRNQGGPITCV